MAKSKLISKKKLQKLLSESLPNLESPAARSILETKDPRYGVQRAREILLEPKASSIKEAIGLLVLSRFLLEEPNEKPTDVVKKHKTDLRREIAKKKKLLEEYKGREGIKDNDPLRINMEQELKQLEQQLGQT